VRGAESKRKEGKGLNTESTENGGRAQLGSDKALEPEVPRPSSLLRHGYGGQAGQVHTDKHGCGPGNQERRGLEGPICRRPGSHTMQSSKG